jgi:hypothetical protein
MTRNSIIHYVGAKCLEGQQRSAGVFLKKTEIRWVPIPLVGNVKPRYHSMRAYHFLPDHTHSQYTCRSCNSNIDVEERGELGEEHLKL